MSVGKVFCSVCYSEFQGTSRASNCSASCKQKSFRNREAEKFYIASIGDLIKVGVSKDVKKRVDAVSRNLGSDVNRVKSFYCKDAYLVEDMIKTSLNEFHVYDEKIKTELFNCDFDQALLVTVSKLRNPKRDVLSNTGRNDPKAEIEMHKLVEDGVSCNGIADNCEDLIFDICAEMSKENPKLVSTITEMSGGSRLIYALLWKHHKLSVSLIEAIKEFEQLKSDIQMKLDLL